MASLSEFVQERIKFHLDFQRGLNDLLKIDFHVNLGTFTETECRILVGTLASALEADKIFLDGEEICTRESILGRVETAFQQLTTDTIGPSQFVLKAGKVELNPAEYKLRQRFYEAKVKELARALGYSEGVFAAEGSGGPRL